MNAVKFGPTVADIMVRKVQTISRETTVNQAARLFAEYGIRHLVVTDSASKVIGVFSERDLMQHNIHCLSHDEYRGTSPVMETITKSPVTVGPKMSLTKAAEILATRKIGCLPVVDSKNCLCGIVSVVDVLRRVGEHTVQPGSAEDVTDHQQTTEEITRLLNDFEMAKDVFESHAANLTTLVYELTEEKKLAETAAQAKQEFLANMSHEIRTPMTAVLGFAEVLLENLSDGENLAAAKAIKRNGDHMLCLINDILDLSKIEAGRLQLEHITCSVREIVCDVHTDLKPKADAKGIVFELGVPADMPEMFETDPVRLRQILYNLVGNAIKFTAQGSVRLAARYRPGTKTSSLQFEIIDTGIGIAQEKLTCIFDWFTQADASTTRRFGGTGLGLAISKRLVGLLGGKITVESRPGKGSTFRFTIAASPVSAGVPELDPGDDKTKATAETTNRFTTQVPPLNCHVLVAEDSVDNQRLVSYILKKAGATVTVAENGKVACDLALGTENDDDDFDVILVDMQMTVLDGYAATRKLRDAGCSVPIIALTAQTMSGDREKCIAAGCDDYVMKPIDRAKLIEMIAHFTEKRIGASD